MSNPTRRHNGYRPNPWFIFLAISAFLFAGCNANGTGVSRPSPTVTSAMPGKPSVTIVGHRGAAGVAPENTLAGFQKAMEIGVDAIELVDSPLQTIAAFAQTNHPYALCDVALALQQFVALTNEIGLPYRGAGTEGANLWLPSPGGAARPTFLAPHAQLAGNLGRGEPMLIVGFRRLRDFYPELIAENLTKQGHRARAAFLPVELITNRHDFTLVHLATQVEAPARRKALAVELGKLVQSGEHIGLPAILGLDAHTAVLGDLESQTGAAIFEIPTLPPSIPGIRLNTALRQHLSKLGVRVDVNMPVVGFHAENGRVSWVETETSGRPLKHRAEAFLLATGGILGGGINSDHTGKIWETVFDLPLTMPSNRDEWFRPRFLDAAGHSIFRAGVTVNRAFQPIDARGLRVYENLWAAGGVLAHTDPIRERSLEGLAISTGIAAARCASQR